MNGRALQETKDEAGQSLRLNRPTTLSHAATVSGHVGSTEERLPATAPSTYQLEHSCAAPLRVLHVITRFDTGGTEYGLLKVTTGLSKKLFEHKICTTRGYNPELARHRQLEEQLLVAGKENGNLQFTVFRLAQIMRAYKPHIVHSRNWGAIEAIPAARLAGVPVVIHSEHGYELDMLGGLPFRRRILRRIFYPLANALFTVTDDLRHYHQKQAWFPGDKIRVIYNGVDTQKFRPSLEMRGQVRREFGLDDETLVVGTVGRLVALKDHLTLLRAAARLVRQNYKVHIILAGSGPEQSRLEQFVAGSEDLTGRVSFVGASDKVSELLQAMDVFVLPSICEGFSNTLLEAMASGLPAIATRVGGNPEVLEEGRSGWLFSPGGDEELAALLGKLLGRRDLRKQLGEAARSRAISRFALQRMLDDYRDLYWELACLRGLRVRS